MPSSGSRSMRRRVIVVLPAPDGEESTRSRPRRVISMGIALSCRSLNVLYPLAQLLDRRLEREPGARQLDIRRFRAQRVGLAMEFLAQEIEAPSDGDALAQQILRRREMR